MDHLIQIIHGGIVIFITWLVWLFLKIPLGWWNNRNSHWVRREFAAFVRAMAYIIGYSTLAWTIGFVWLSLL